MTGANRPPVKVISFSGARTTRGPTSWNFAGSRFRQTCGGSTVWSSTEMILGKLTMADTLATN
ncbi:hypothetical protein GCM10010319_15710 [Streptomyces blastmyceticus]|uniref:Uncharacterized protein n=1 Tax=Streptomyces blastmyceticus TaxID=68180 RepID=A0ABP3GA22_9ACTN